MLIACHSVGVAWNNNSIARVGRGFSDPIPMELSESEAKEIKSFIDSAPDDMKQNIDPFFLNSILGLLERTYKDREK